MDTIKFDYRVLETTFDGGDAGPLVALEVVLNAGVDDGWEPFMATRVREERGQWVDVIVSRRRRE